MKDSKKLVKRYLSKVAEEILFTMQNLGQLASDIAFTPYGQLRLHPKESYYRELRNLQGKGLVKKTKRSYGKSIYVLTYKGRQLLRKRKVPVKRTDGFSSIIIFDIPEEKSRERTFFRRYLLRNSYTLLQRSVLISPNKISDEIKELVEELGIRQYVTSFDGKVTYLF